MEPVSLFIIIIRRYVRPDREQEFLDTYRADLSRHVDFLGETLTRLSDDQEIPPAMATLFSSIPNCLTYVNIAKWKNWASFVGQCKMTPGWFDAEIEVAPRERVVLELIEEIPASGGGLEV
jgi:hypothetical protein